MPENVILVSTNVIDLYPSISHQAVKEALDKRKRNKVSMGKLVKVAEFMSKNNYFQFLDKVLLLFAAIIFVFCRGCCVSRNRTKLFLLLYK